MRKLRSEALLPEANYSTIHEINEEIRIRRGQPRRDACGSYGVGSRVAIQYQEEERFSVGRGATILPSSRNPAAGTGCWVRVSAFSPPRVEKKKKEKEKEIEGSNYLHLHSLIFPFSISLAS